MSQIFFGQKILGFSNGSWQRLASMNFEVHSILLQFVWNGKIYYLPDESTSYLVVLSCESNKKVSKTWAMFGWDAEDGKHAELKWAKGANWLVTKLNHFVMLVFRFLLYSWRWQFRFSLSCSVCLELWNPSYVAGRCSPFPV